MCGTCGCKSAETKLSKTSCCCGADEANPCACMKAPEPMECSAKAPKCACYKALEKNAETFEANSGKRMYCPKCQKNRTWNRGFKKEKMESGENPYDFVFYVCQKCDYAYDPKTSKKMDDNWKEMFGYDAETFEDCEVCYATVDKGTLNDVQAGRICNECHKMNQYEGGTKTIKTPYNAETFELNAEDDFMGFEYYYLIDAHGNKSNDFPSLEEAQIARSYVPNRNLKIMRRRHEGRNMVGKTTEITEFDPYEEQLKNPNYFKNNYRAEYDEEDMVYCNHCSDIVGNEKEVYGDETVEYEMANGELVCVPCYKIWMKEYKNDLDPHYTPFYAETFEVNNGRKAAKNKWEKRIIQGWGITNPHRHYIEAKKGNRHIKIHRDILYPLTPYLIKETGGSGEYYFRTLNDALGWLDDDGKDFMNAETFEAAVIRQGKAPKGAMAKAMMNQSMMEQANIEAIIQELENKVNLGLISEDDLMASLKKKFGAEYDIEVYSSEEFSKELEAYFADLKKDNPKLAKIIEFKVKNEEYLPKKLIESSGYDYEILEAWNDYVIDDDKYALFDPCPACEGEGWIMTSYTPATRSDPADGDGEDCGDCGGSGKIDPSDYMYYDDKGEIEYEAETKISKICPNCEKYGRNAITDYICDSCAQCKRCCETSYGCYDVALCNDCDGSFIGKDIDGCCGSCDNCCECGDY